MFCSKCGKEIPDEAIVCVNCGVPTQKYYQDQLQHNTVVQPATVFPTVQIDPCNKWIAFLLCFFLGFLGFHKFYEGKIFMGILYILSCGFFGVGIIIDLIALLCKPNPYYPS